MKKTAQEIAVTKRDLLKEQEVFYFSDYRQLSLTKLRRKDYHNLVQEGKNTVLLLLNAGLASFLTLPLVEVSGLLFFFVNDNSYL